MSPRVDPWEEIPRKDRKLYHDFVLEFAPLIRQFPKDLWINLRIRYRVAILKPKHKGKHIARIRLAVHYVWDEPLREDIKRIQPKWVKSTIQRRHGYFLEHVSKWGPGDVELVHLILQRKPPRIDPDLLETSEFFIHEMKYRTGAHLGGVVSQIKKGNWTKLGNIQVPYIVKDAPFEIHGVRPVLTVESEHHSFYKPGETPDKCMKWPIIDIEDVKYFTKKEWKHFKIASENRGAEPWELA